MDRRHTPRIPTFDYQGTFRYSWTICTHLRRRVFASSDVTATVTSQFLHASEVCDVAVLAYCFMPDHLHLLIEGKREVSCATNYVSRAKQTSGYWFKKRTGQRLWQRMSWDRVLRQDDDWLEVTRYILANPLRAGLVEHPLDYPYSGSFVFTRQELMDAFNYRPAG